MPKILRIGAVILLSLVANLIVVLSTGLADEALPDNKKAVSVIGNDISFIYPLNFNFIVPYVPPIGINQEFFSPTPPGEMLWPPEPILNPDYTFIPWTPPEIGPVIPGIPDISDLIEFLLPFDLLIIAHEDFLDELAPLKIHKDDTDISTRIYSWQYLVERFSAQGRDDPERIKKAIASFRKECGIKYVMLVGDSDRLPVRYHKTYDPTHWGHGYVPSDLYYAALFTVDGTGFDDWDGNGNGIFGEMQGGTWTAGSTLADINLDGVNLYPDVAVGRVPASTEAEVTTYVNKVISYEFDSYQSSWFDRALFVVPGYLSNDGKYYEYPGSWAAKEDIGALLSVAGITFTRLYDSRIEGLTPGLGDDEPTAANISAGINDGVGFVNFSGHGNTTTWGSYNSTHVAALTNGNRLPIVFAAACSTAQFHFGDSFLDVGGSVFNRLTQCPVYNDEHRCYPVNPSAATFPEPAAVQSSIYDVDSLAEEFLVKRATGGIGYIGSYTGAQGGSQLLDRYFFEAYRYSMKPPTLGYMWNYAVRRYIDNNFHIDFNSISNWYPAALWHHIQKYMLFGDPSLRVGGVSRFQRADIAGQYKIGHDGWLGNLVLIKSNGDYIEGIPNLGGTYTGSDGFQHSVRGIMRTATYPLYESWGPDHKINFFVDFADTAGTSDDQPFEAYFFTRSRDALAGITWWNDIPFGFFCRKNEMLSGFGPNLVPGTVTLNDFPGTYRMNHDGWQGVLELWVPYISLMGAGNLAGRYTANSDGAVYNVRGTVKTDTNAGSLPADWPAHKIEFYIDFAKTADLNDDQEFEGYLFTQTKDAMAGVTWWNETPFGFFAEKKRNPKPSIFANGTQGVINLDEGQEASITVQLDPGVLMEDPCDFWVVAVTPFGNFSLVLPFSWQSGIAPLVQTVPVAIPDPVEILRLAFPAGSYTVYFGVDDQPNGILDGNIWYDAVTIQVE